MINKIKWNKQFEYPPSVRSLIDNQRHYDIYGTKLPSVTTILSATQSAEKKASLLKWKQKVGDNKADKIRDDAAARGTIMHRILEGFIKDEGHMDLTKLGIEAGTMAQNIIDKGHFEPLEEVWGLEMPLWYPGLYAGASDVAGLYDGRESIIDFKQSNKYKKREWIDDYFIQCAAYAVAHNYVYGTNIQSGVILISVKGGDVWRHVSYGKEFQDFTFEWLRRVDLYDKLKASGTKNP